MISMMLAVAVAATPEAPQFLKVERFWCDGLGCNVLYTFTNVSDREITRDVGVECTLFDAAGKVLDVKTRTFFIMDTGPIRPGWSDRKKMEFGEKGDEIGCRLVGKNFDMPPPKATPQSERPPKPPRDIKIQAKALYMLEYEYLVEHKRCSTDLKAIGFNPGNDVQTFKIETTKNEDSSECVFVVTATHDDLSVSISNKRRAGIGPMELLITRGSETAK